MPSILYRSFQKLHLPLAVLIILLQRAPQIYSTLLARIGAPSVQIIQKAFFAATALAAPHAVSGATSSKYKVNAKTYNLGNGDVSHFETGQVGESVGISISNTVTAASWRIEGELPPGLTLTDTFQETFVADGIINAAFIQLIGTPTEEGIYPFKLRPWSQINGQGNDAPGDLAIFFTIDPGAPPVPSDPPSIRYTKNADTLTLTWNSSEATDFQLVRSTDLKTWSPVQENAAESNGESSMQVSLLESDVNFYRFEPITSN